MPAASFWRIFSAASGEDGISPPEVSTWSEPRSQARGERHGNIVVEAQQSDVAIRYDGAGVCYVPLGATGETAMPATGALLAVVIMDRPLCIDCISDKTNLNVDEIQSLLTSIERTVSLHRTVDRCRACGNSTTVYSVIRND